MNDRDIETIKDLLLALVEAIGDGSIISNNSDYAEIIDKTMNNLK